MNTKRIADELFHDWTTRVVQVVSPEDRAEVWAQLRGRIHRVEELEQPKKDDGEVAHVGD